VLRSTVHDYLMRWNWDGTFDRIHDALYRQAHDLAGKEANPVAMIIDGQNVKSAETGDRTHVTNPLCMYPTPYTAM
jgi:hypothetical protein